MKEEKRKFYVQTTLALMLHKGFTSPPGPRPLLEQSVRMELVGNLMSANSLVGVEERPRDGSNVLIVTVDDTASPETRGVEVP